MARVLGAGVRRVLAAAVATPFGPRCLLTAAPPGLTRGAGKLSKREYANLDHNVGELIAGFNGYALPFLLWAEHGTEDSTLFIKRDSGTRVQSYNSASTRLWPRRTLDAPSCGCVWRPHSLLRAQRARRKDAPPHARAVSPPMAAIARWAARRCMRGTARQPPLTPAPALAAATRCTACRYHSRMRSCW